VSIARMAISHVRRSRNRCLRGSVENCGDGGDLRARTEALLHGSRPGCRGATEISRNGSDAFTIATKTTALFARYFLTMTRPPTSNEMPAAALSAQAARCVRHGFADRIETTGRLMAEVLEKPKRSKRD
jgi:hypothetical protein